MQYRTTEELAQEVRTTPYLTTEELAQEMRTTPPTVRYWRHKNTGPRSFRVGKRVLYDRVDVDAWIAQARAKETSGPAA